MARAGDILRSALVWAGFAGVGLVAFPPMLLGTPLVLVDPNRALSDAYFRVLGRALLRISPRWTVRVDDRERLRTGGPYVLVVNHQSLADLLVMCFLGHPTKYLGKASVFSVPVLGWALRIAGEVPVVRGDRESGAKALADLRTWLDRGVSVCLFPEGTRSDDGALGRFKLGAFRLAIDAGRPIAPIVITGARELLRKGSVVFERDADIHVRVLPPVPTAGSTPEDTETLAERVRQMMLDAIDADA